MAIPRPGPYIWATWLSRLMAGSVACHWQFWFQTHHKLTERVPSNFDSVAWTVAHTRLLIELQRELQSQGLHPRKEFGFQIRVPPWNAIVAGKVDCMVDDGDLIIYDCKTGRQREADRIQVMVYMHALRQYPQFAERRIRGVVVYPEERVAIPHLPEQFAEHFDYFVDYLAAPAPAQQEPGPDCRYCPLTHQDCPARQD